jgi:predicted DNA-binding protein YlxM (UPF0122 family)
MNQPDIEKIIREAAVYAGSMTGLAEELGITRQTLYACISRQRCRQSTRLLILQFIMLMKFGQRRVMRKKLAKKLKDRATNAKTK